MSENDERVFLTISDQKIGDVAYAGSSAYSFVITKAGGVDQHSPNHQDDAASCVLR
jgi:hypothetical protein